MPLATFPSLGDPVRDRAVTILKAALDVLCVVEPAEAALQAEEALFR